MEGKYSVYDVSSYVIKYSNEKLNGISNLKLQKILYFIQAFFLVYREPKQPAFNEKIEAWDFRPVVPVIYHKYKAFGGGDIPTEQYAECNIEEQDKKHIEYVLNGFANYSATDLVQLTQNQAPWKNVYNKYDSYNSNEITKKSIYEYFNAKRERNNTIN